MHRLTVVIPTRNRAELAQTALRGLLSEPGDFSVVVSDNSSAETEASALQSFVRRCADARVSYVRPPGEMDMARHWDWAVGTAIERSPATHLLVNTDRMIVRPGAIRELAGLLASAPDMAISYNVDRINDTVDPMVLERKRWSGAIAELSSRHLLELAARCEFPESIPRLLNAVVPVAAIREVRQRFGDICISISPDFGYGFRHLLVRDAILFYDKSMLIHHAVMRSNGTSFLRGVDSPDLKDFKRFLGEARFPATPFPEFFTVGNAMAHEYCALRERAPDAGLPPIDMPSYVRCLYRDYTFAETDAQRALLRGLLEQRGLGDEIAWRERRDAFKRRTRFIERMVRRMVRGPNYRPPERAFATVGEALAYDASHPTPRQDTTAHLARLAPKAIRRAPGVPASE